ncbi:hypothetical protein GW17_00007748 [Ensete ventricosum]|nr:hypothetical protein GW17_00007748 [Ensete ventricosum]
MRRHLVPAWGIADFWKEALITSCLHHPNIVSFYGVVRDGPGGSLATVTEFMVNGSLKQFLQKKDRYNFVSFLLTGEEPYADMRCASIIAVAALVARELLLSPLRETKHLPALGERPRRLQIFCLCRKRSGPRLPLSSTNGSNSLASSTASFCCHCFYVQLLPPLRERIVAFLAIDGHLCCCRCYRLQFLPLLLLMFESSTVSDFFLSLLTVLFCPSLCSGTILFSPFY